MENKKRVGHDLRLLLAKPDSRNAMRQAVQARSLSTFDQNGLTRNNPTDKYDVDYSYDPNEDRALRKFPGDIFREGPGCRRGLT